MSQVTVTDFIAVVFDFDDTLMPDSTTKFLQSRGIDTEKFWQDAGQLIKNGYDQPSAYIRLMLEEVGPDKKLGPITNADLRAFGATLEHDFYPGLPEFFDDLKSEVKKEFANIEVEYYLVSGGLQAMLEGVPAVTNHFSGVYGCKLGECANTGLVNHIKRSVTFTEKTRYLFEINKGIKQLSSDTNPFLVNENVPQQNRRISFRNIAFVGDGLTDIPCFSLVSSSGGQAFGVFDPSNRDKTKRALEKFLIPHRVITMLPPEYGPTAALGSMLRTWVINRATGIQLDRQMTEKSSNHF